jgi:hypothetical protein
LIFLQTKEARAQRATLKLGRGTLVVALGNRSFIVVASDSRRTDLNAGSHSDDSKKLFLIGQKRILAIAGLADASLRPAPWITAQIAPMLDSMLGDLPYGIDNQYWDEPPPPPNLPEELKTHWNDEPLWWAMIMGPLQTITNIAATYGPIDQSVFLLQGVIAGFKSTGEAKIEVFTLFPVLSISNSGRQYIGLAQKRERLTSNGKLICRTAGVTELANQILEGEITENLISETKKYPAIKAFLKRRQLNSVDAISSHEMVELAKDLIRATAAQNEAVGASPIQIATIKPGERAHLEQPKFNTASHFLSPDGTWYLGSVMGDEFPFDQVRAGAVYVNCLIEGDKTPIPLGGNYFYGNTIVNATFIYHGGRISFDNNHVHDSRLLIDAGVDETELQPILQLFSCERAKK